MSQKMVDVVKEMVQAPSCCAELKTAGKEWLEAVGTEEQGEKAVALLAEAKADICTIDQVYDLLCLIQERRCLVRSRLLLWQSMQRKSSQQVVNIVTVVRV